MEIINAKCKIAAYFHSVYVLSNIRAIYVKYIKKYNPIKILQNFLQT